jgi:signal transduction histidine kinase
MASAADRVKAHRSCRRVNFSYPVRAVDTGEASGGEGQFGAAAPPPADESNLPPGWLVLGVLMATMLGFAGSMAFSQHVAAKLDEDAVSIATNASPAIERLSAARGELFQLSLATVSAVLPLGEGRLPDRAPFVESLARLHDQLSAYLAMPFYPGERERFVDVGRATHDLDARVSAFLGFLEAKDSRGAATVLRTGVSPDAARVDSAIGNLIAFNAEQQHRLATDIPKQRRQGDRIGYVLEAATAVFGLILMGLVTRAIHQYASLLRSRHRLAADHARRVVAFGAKLESIIAASTNISAAITTAADPHRVFQIIADEARLVVNAQYCAVGCGTDPTRPFDPWVASGMPPTTVAALGRPPRAAGLLGAVIQEGHPIRLADVTAHPAFRGLPPEHPPLGAFLGVPILKDGHNVGNLYLARQPGRSPFTGEDERAADLLAGYVGVAIGNAQLYNAALAAKHAREDLLATVSHDLKNPLNAIRLTTSTLRRTAGEGRTVELAERIDRAAERMTRLIDDLLHAAKIEAGGLHAERHPEDVASLVESAVDMFRVVAAERSIQLVPRTPSPPVSALCERNLILRVLANLIGNAIKFSPEGSSISVVAEERADQVHFAVSDTGPGIPTEYLSHVFDRYWQQTGGDRRGSGLGLYIAKGIAEAHGGRIWIDSVQGQGTTIHFSLPSFRGTDGAAPSP